MDPAQLQQLLNSSSPFQTPVPGTDNRMTPQHFTPVPGASNPQTPVPGTASQMQSQMNTPIPGTNQMLPNQPQPPEGDFLTILLNMILNQQQPR